MSADDEPARFGLEISLDSAARKQITLLTSDLKGIRSVRKCPRLLIHIQISHEYPEHENSFLSENSSKLISPPKILVVYTREVNRNPVNIGFTSRLFDMHHSDLINNHK